MSDVEMLRETVGHLGSEQGDGEDRDFATRGKWTKQEVGPDMKPQTSKETCHPSGDSRNTQSRHQKSP